jgi:hypothetical protein
VEAAAGLGRLGLVLVPVASFMVVLDFSIVNVAPARGASPHGNPAWITPGLPDAALVR